MVLGMVLMDDQGSLITGANASGGLFFHSFVKFGISVTAFALLNGVGSPAKPIRQLIGLPRKVYEGCVWLSRYVDPYLLLCMFFPLKAFLVHLRSATGLWNP
ncbi:hypothetical protein DVH24_002357 [Malus domestica]|uniref:Uncharacterized protein n=1 Tax=Malus domestica TaxID=3750 RepID=A0A498I7H4_MALDO|nr:hypothetical protein DVH24_002357 [Malus domestica]